MPWIGTDPFFSMVGACGVSEADRRLTQLQSLALLVQMLQMLQPTSRPLRNTLSRRPVSGQGCEGAVGEGRTSGEAQKLMARFEARWRRQ